MILSKLIENILVVNLDRDKNRLEYMKESLKKYGMQDRFVRIPAILGSEIKKEDLKDMVNELTTTKNKTIRQKIRNSLSNTPGVIGCGMSHKKAWKHIIDNNLTSALILEDDAAINELILKLDRITIPDDWDIIYLGYHMDDSDNSCSRVSRIKNRKVMKRINNNVLKYENDSRYIVGCYGYILSNKAARKLYNEYNILEYSVDIFVPLQSKIMNVYIINPKPITHCYEFGSSTVRKLDLRKTENFKQSYYEKIINNNTKSMYYFCKNIRYFLIICLIILIIFYIYNRECKSIFIFMIIILTIFFISLYLKKQRSELYEYLDDLLINNKYITNNTLIGNCNDTLIGNYHSYYDPFKSIWTPKATLIAQELLEKLYFICKDNNIQWSLFYSSMIGWARHNGQPIPWDDSIEVTMSKDYKSFIKNLIKHDNTIGCCDVSKEKGSSIYRIYFKNEGFFIPCKHKCNQKVSWPFIDIFFYSKKSDTISVGLNSEIKMPQQFEYITTTFMNVPVFVFKNYKYILYQLFGASWYRICKSSYFNNRLQINNSKCIFSEKCSVLMLDESYDIENQIINNIRNKELKTLILDINNSETEIEPSEYESKSFKTTLKNFFTGMCHLYNRQRDSLNLKITNYLKSHPQTIPKIIHQVWIGPNNPPMKRINTIKEFVSQNPEWSYKLWRDEDISELGLINSLEYDEEKSYCGKCNIIKVELLFRYGGIYIDTDVIWLGNRSFNELLDAKTGFFLSYETENEELFASSVVGSSQYNPISYYIIKNMSNITTLCKGLPAFKTTGPYIFNRTLLPIRHIITTYQSYYFLPNTVDRNNKEKRSIEIIKKKYPNSFFFQYGYTTNNYNDNDIL